MARILRDTAVWSVESIKAQKPIFDSYPLAYRLTMNETPTGIPVQILLAESHPNTDSGNTGRKSKQRRGGRSNTPLQQHPTTTRL